MKTAPIGFIVFLCGMFVTLAAAPFYVWPLGVASVALLYGLVRNAGSKKQAFGAGLLWALGWQLSALHWLPRAFYMDAGNSIEAAIVGGIPALLGLALYGAVGIGLVCLAAYAASGYQDIRILGYQAVRRSTVFVGGWVLLEVLKSLSPYGFPWLPLGAMLAHNPYLSQLASIGGVFGLSLLVLVLAVLLSHLSYKAPGGRWLLAPALLVLAMGFGYWRLYNAPTLTTDGPTVRVVQPNIHGLHKWEAATRYAYLLRSLEVAFPSTLDKKPDVIVMPETAVAFYIDEETQIRQLLASKLKPGQTLFTGTVRRELPLVADPEHISPTDVDFFNSLAAVDSTGKIIDLYDKHLLVPFGEVIPFHDFINKYVPFIRTVSESRLDYAYGHAPALLNTPVGGVVALICYEGIFPFYVATWAQNARFLLNITNDNWFTGTIALDQHAALATLRAIETGKPLIRAANTGISLVVDGYGRTVAKLPVNQSALMDAPLPAAAPTPLFMRAVTFLSRF